MVRVLPWPARMTISSLTSALGAYVRVLPGRVFRLTLVMLLILGGLWLVLISIAGLANWFGHHPFSLVQVFVLVLGLFLLGLAALYVVVRVIRAAWRHGSSSSPSSARSIAHGE